MQRVNPDAASAQPGEQSFILQLKPSVPPEADSQELSERIDQFVSLYLESRVVEGARFGRLDPLTWAIAAPQAMTCVIEDMRADISEILFGAPDGDSVRLDQRIDEHAARCRSETDKQVSEPDWEPAQSSAATRAAMDDESDVFDLDAPSIDIIDSQTLDTERWDAATPNAEASDAFQDFDDQDDFGSDKTDFDEFDLGSLDDDDWAVSEGFGNGADAAQSDAPLASTSQSAIDVAAELASFRSEMREIAAGIPGGQGAEALAQFRAELDAVSGALGTRVDGAATRIETAAEDVKDAVEAIDPDGLSQSAQRIEASAQLMETSVREAVTALTAALGALSAREPASGASRASESG